MCRFLSRIERKISEEYQTEDRIYAALATQDHQSFVDLVVADALGKSFSLAG